VKLPASHNRDDVQIFRRPTTNGIKDVAIPDCSGFAIKGRFTRLASRVPQQVSKVHYPCGVSKEELLGRLGSTVKRLINAPLFLTERTSPYRLSQMEKS
jgi:hypothetical protein